MKHGTRDPRDRESPAELPDGALGAEVELRARCADGTLHPDAWFPVSTSSEAARREAAGAIAICAACQVRSACLELALRHWTIGQHGVWGGLVPAERGALRLQRLADAVDVPGGAPAPAAAALSGAVVPPRGTSSRRSSGGPR